MAKVNIVLDASKFDTFETCACKFNYRYNHNKVPTEKSAPLDRGVLVHVGCEQYYKALKDGIKYEERVKISSEAISISSVESDLSTEAVNRVIDVLEEHYDFWRVTDENYEILVVEEPFSYVLFEDDEVRIIMTGKIDLIVNDHTSSSRYDNLVIDHKSYDRDSPLRRRTNQFQNYATAVGTNYVLVNRIGMQTSVPVNKKMKRVPLSYDPLLLNQWKDNVVRVLKTQFLDCAAENIWPMNETSCDKYNRLCEYNDVCDSSGIDAKTYKLTAFFKDEVPWDVTKNL